MYLEQEREVGAALPVVVNDRQIESPGPAGDLRADLTKANDA